ncbi:MAG: spheroidene monooxygenase [Ferruginibacter sp.]
MTVSFTIIKYRRRFIFFAFLAMALFRLPLWFSKRCSFWKLLGSGKGGSFSKKPDLRQWAMLTVSQLNFKHVQLKHYPAQLVIRRLYGPFIGWWLRIFKCETVTYLLVPVEGHGIWDGKNAFGDLPRKSDYDGIIAVLTRATIRLSGQKRFWAHVQNVSNRMLQSPGFIQSYGVGEVPYFKQATFSIWENKAAMSNFAYRSEEHAAVVEKTRRENWYSEDMFVRFRIDGCISSIVKDNPLKGKL